MEFHAIGYDHRLMQADLESRLGRLGAGLNTLVRELAVDTPSGFVVTFADAAHLAETGWDAEALSALDTAIDVVESETGRFLGDPANPLLVAVRGVRRTILDLGINPANTGVVAGEVGGPSAAGSRLCAYLEKYADVIVHADMAPFLANIDAAHILSDGAEQSVELLHILGQQHHRTLGDRFPDSALEQLKASIARLGHDGPVVVQAMVHGSAEGVVSSRDLVTGDEGALHADGFENLTAPIDLLLRGAEIHHRDAVELELVTHGDSVHVIGGGVADRSGVAAIRIAHALTSDPEIALTKAEAVARISPLHVEQILHQTFDTNGDQEILTSGLAASPGAAVGMVVFTADDAAALSAAGEAVILVAQETSPEDVHGMEVAAGILTTRGGLASHAAVVARGWGIPAVCGAEQILLGHDSFVVGTTHVARGDVVSIDGSTGAVVVGAMSTSISETPPEFDEVLGWADEIRAGHLEVRANADSGADAIVARQFGAEGIGLCRTEHMFLTENRLQIARQMILATSPAKERAALTRLRLAQRDDFVELLEAMDGLPVTVRLLDPPLHEFLPDLEELAVADALGELDAGGRELLAAARMWSEQNPMIGTRGVRLGWLKPGLYEMQVRALVEAVGERLAAGGDPVVEVMIPLTVSAPELEGARGWVQDALDAEEIEVGRISIGTMIETPRAALLAGQLAEHADFFSFGTNDLTQLTYGFSRDDVETRIMGLYLKNNLLPSNPFEHLDDEAVGELVRLAAERGRSVKADLKLGICGEHGGDPASIAICLDAGLDYVSCSPYRVPVARLAAAQAVIEKSR